MTNATPFCEKCRETLASAWCRPCLALLRAADARMERDASTVPALRASWEALDATYWGMLNEAQQTTTTPDFKRYVERCRLRASAAYRKLESAEVAAGMRCAPTEECVYPDEERRMGWGGVSLHTPQQETDQ